jgi:hypothetical protein
MARSFGVRFPGSGPDQLPNPPLCH